MLAARAFVGWYNGLPQWASLSPDLSGTDVAILGQVWKSWSGGEGEALRERRIKGGCIVEACKACALSLRAMPLHSKNREIEMRLRETSGVSL